MSTPQQTAEEVRRLLREGGSAEHSAGVQWFFREEIQSRGWYTKPLRQAAHRLRRSLLREHELRFLVAVADELFTGRVLEEKAFAVLLLEESVDDFGQREFRLFESWLDRVSSWADHDALVSYLIGPMMVADAEAQRVRRIYSWARHADQWHRRAAAVALIRGVRQRKLFGEVEEICELLLDDPDDMVQKGLGWLLRETAKADPRRTVPLLMAIRDRAPRLVLRTACETLPKNARARILKK